MLPRGPRWIYCCQSKMCICQGKSIAWREERHLSKNGTGITQMFGMSSCRLRSWCLGIHRQRCQIDGKGTARMSQTNRSRKTPTHQLTLWTLSAVFSQSEGNGNLQTLICVPVARPRQCHTLPYPVPWQNWMAAYLGYTLRMKMLFRGWPIMVHDTHTRRRRRRIRLRIQEICIGTREFMRIQCKPISNTLHSLIESSTVLRNKYTPRFIWNIQLVNSKGQLQSLK